MDTIRQSFGHQRTTTRAHLACVAWINLHAQSTSICRFVDCELCKLVPGNIGNTLVEFVAKDNGVFFHHANDIQIFQHDHAIGIDPLARKFMRKVGTFDWQSVRESAQRPSCA